MLTIEEWLEGFQIWVYSALFHWKYNSRCWRCLSFNHTGSSVGTNIWIYIKIIAGEGGITSWGFIKHFQLYSWSQIAKRQIVKVTLSISRLAQMGKLSKLFILISRLAQIGKLSKLYFQFPGWFKWANCQNHISNF